jgi:predicted transcriptional regulator
MVVEPSRDPKPLIDVLGRLPLLDELRRGALRREDLERRLGISTPTSYRHTNWLTDVGLAEESGEGVAFTRSGKVVAEEATRFETAVRTALGRTEIDRDLLLDTVRYAPGLEALAAGPCDRRELENLLGVSRTTAYRFTRSFEKSGVVERSDGNCVLTAAGEGVAAAVAVFEPRCRTALRLGPVLDAVGETTPAFDLEAFADATVTTTEHGDAHSPVNRCIRLLQGTGSLRAVDMNSIAPVYLGDVQRRIVDGMTTETIMMPEVVASILTEYPDRCIEACESGNLRSYLHDDLSYGLVVLDDRVGIGVRGEGSRTLRMFADTDSPGARRWAEAVFDSYRADAVEMVGFTPWAFRRAMERLSPDLAGTVDR